MSQMSFIILNEEIRWFGVKRLLFISVSQF